MSNINFWVRLGNLWSGFVSLWIADVEKKHPEIAYENAINGMISKYTKLKGATAAIIRRRDEINARLTHEQNELRQITGDLETAVDGGQDDLALVLIQKKTALETSLQDFTMELKQAENDAEDAKASLLSVKSEVQKLKDEKDRMLAKLTSAQARIKIQEQLEGLSVDAEVQALENVRGHIKNTIAEANLGKEIQGSDLDYRLKALRKQTGSVTAKTELERLKQIRAQKQGNKQM